MLLVPVFCLERFKGDDTPQTVSMRLRHCEHWYCYSVIITCSILLLSFFIFGIQRITVKYKVDIKNYYIPSIPTISSLN